MNSCVIRNSFHLRKQINKQTTKSPTLPNKGKNIPSLTCCMGNYWFVRLLCCCNSEVLLHFCVLLASLKYKIQGGWQWSKARLKVMFFKYTFVSKTNRSYFKTKSFVSSKCLYWCIGLKNWKIQQSSCLPPSFPCPPHPRFQWRCELTLF